ncbi:MAG: DoxX family protein [Bacteriovorax sp.]|nr:DoxX family protein [Bacteriovorax sp.]
MSFFQTYHHSKIQSLSLLLLRLVVGCAFFIHGSGKIHTPFSWMPPQVPIPAFLQFLAAMSEYCGGIALILGIITPLASFGIGCTMLSAVYMHVMMRHDTFVNLSGGMSYEPALGYLVIMILFIAMGPGKFSLDKVIFGERK